MSVAVDFAVQQWSGAQRTHWAATQDTRVEISRTLLRMRERPCLYKCLSGLQEWMITKQHQQSVHFKCYKLIRLEGQSENTLINPKNSLVSEQWFHNTDLWTAFFSPIASQKILERDAPERA